MGHRQTQKCCSQYTEPFSKDLQCDANLKLSCPEFKNVLIQEAQKVNLPKVERLKQDPFPNNYLLAFFSSGVYSCDDINNKLHLPDNWILLTTAKNDGKLNKYFGAAFFNPVEQQIVVAHKGTELSNFGSLWTDVIGIWAHYQVEQLSSAATFVDIVKEAIKDINVRLGIRYHISLTGHSLGGWLAQITTFTVEYLKMETRYFFKCIDKSLNYHAHTVVFDSPGCEEMLVKLKKSYDLRYYNFLSLDQLDITVFLSAPNKINTCNHHIGTLYRLSCDCSSMTYLQKHTFIYNFITHNMKKMLSQFDYSGKVVHGEICEILDWPVSGILFNKEYKAFFKHGDASNNYHLTGDEELIQNEMGKFFSGIRYQPKSLNETECCVRLFTQEELWVLECWNSLLKKGAVLNKINEFFDSICYNDGVLPDFKIDLKARKIHCSTKEDLEKIVRNCKQLMRWFSEDITDALKAQLCNTPTSFDTVLRMNTENYMRSLKDSKLQFVDNLSIGEFLKSDKAVLNIITNHLYSDIEYTRIHKIIETIHNFGSEELKLYVLEMNYVFVSWKYLATLRNVFDINYIFTDFCKFNLIIINCCDDLELNEAEKQFLGNILNSIRQFHKNKSKKFIFLTSDCYDKELLSETFISHLETLPKEIVDVKKISSVTFVDLQSKSQMFVLDNIVIKLQNNELSLRNILNLDEMNALEGYLKNHLNSLIDSKMIASFILGNSRLEIGHRVPQLCDSEVSRLKFYREITIKELKNLITKNIGENVYFFITYTEENKCLIDEVNSWNSFYEFETSMVQTNKEAFENFMRHCSKNRNKQIYWFDLDHKSIILKQLYNSEFYIHRKFIYSKFKLKIHKPEEYENPDLFIFSNINKNEAVPFIENLIKTTYLVKENIKVASSEEKANEKFEKESQGTRPVHWFIVDKKGECVSFIWNKSKGSLDNIRKNLVVSEQKTLDEKEINRKTRDTWIIADGPGAGKSTTLTNMFDGLKNTWVLRINLKDVEYKSDQDELLSLDDVITFLLENSKSTKCNHMTKSLLAYLLRNKSLVSVCVLFDGFDEIKGSVDRETLKLQNYVISVLKFLQCKTNANIWVTTRDNKKELLENSLSVFVIKFGAIDLEELRRFIKGFWKCHLSYQLIEHNVEFSEVENKMDIYIKELFSKAEDVFGKGISKFIGIPLQMRMLGELAVPNAELFNQAADFRVNIPNNVLEFFRAFIHYKYGIYFNKTKLSVSLNDVTTNWFREDVLMEKHQQLAFDKVFPDENEGSLKFNFDDLVELHSVGLLRLNSSYSDFDFIDRNIAYYFIANMTVNLLRTNNRIYFSKKYPALECVLLTEMLLNSEYRVIRLFIDNYFSEIFQLIDVIDGRNKMQFYGRRIVKFIAKQETMKQLCNHLNQTAFHILVYEQFTYVLNFLIHSIKENEDIKENVISFLIKRDKFHETALRVALRMKYFNFVEQFIDLISNYSADLQQQILLSTIFVRYEDWKLEEIEYFSECVKNNSELNTILGNIKNKYVLIRKIHEASKSGCKNTIEQIFENLSKNFRIYLMNTVDKDGSTPPLLSVKYKHREITKFFVENGADLDTEDHHNMTLVARAAQNGDFDTVKFLVEKGCDYERSDRRKLNPLIHAAKKGFLQIVQYFIETCGIDKNYRDMFGNSSLWWAAKSGQGAVVKYLIENKADIESENKHGLRPLHVSIKSQNWSIMKQIVEAGADVNIPDGFGISPLDRVKRAGKQDMVDYLIKKGARTTLYQGNITP